MRPIVSPHRERVRRAFSKAETYDAYAHVQAIVAEQLAQRIVDLNLKRPLRILEIGCGTGFLTKALCATAYGQEHGGSWLITDLSADMLARCRTRMAGKALAPQLSYAQLDGEYGTPDTETQPFDLICSSLAIQWFDNATAALRRMCNWLAPDGHLVVSTLGDESFWQWHQAHSDEGLQAGTPSFHSAKSFSALDPKDIWVDNHIERHPDAQSFIRSLKAIGAGTPRAGHQPLSISQMRRVMDRFTKNGCEVTYQVVTCHLHKPQETS